MDCPVALSLLRRGFQPRHRVFFKDESVAIAAATGPAARACARSTRSGSARGRLCAPPSCSPCRPRPTSAAAVSRPICAAAGAAFAMGATFGAAAGERALRGRLAVRDRAAAGRDAAPGATPTATPGAGRLALARAAGRPARRAALQRHHGPELRAQGPAQRLGLGGDPVQGERLARRHQLADADGGAAQVRARRAGRCRSSAPTRRAA